MVNAIFALFPAESCDVPLRKTKRRASFSWEERGNLHVIFASLDLAITFLLAGLLGCLECPTRDIMSTEMQCRGTVVDAEHSQHWS